MSKTYCSNCGRRNPFDALYCNACGTPLHSDKRQTQYQSSQYQDNRYQSNPYQENQPRYDDDLNRDYDPRYDSRPVYSIELKSVGLGLILSFFLPGLGHLYAGRIDKGLGILIVLESGYLYRR